jgi:DNA-directed RNA polymerase specialized sigma24 family protein
VKTLLLDHSAMRGGYECTAVLNRQWQELSHNPAIRIDHWRDAVPELSGCRTLGDVIAAIAEHGDRILRGLLPLGHDDPNAHFTILQYLLPRLVRMAIEDRAHTVAEYVSEAWVGITTFPLERRKSSVVANILLDARKRVWAEDRILPTPDEPESWGIAQSCSRAEAVLNEAERLGLLPDKSLRVLRTVYLDGLPSHQAAELLGMPTGTIRWICSRALSQLRSYRHLL